MLISTALANRVHSRLVELRDPRYEADLAEVCMDGVVQWKPSTSKTVKLTVEFDRLDRLVVVSHGRDSGFSVDEAERFLEATAEYIRPSKRAGQCARADRRNAAVKQKNKFFYELRHGLVTN